MKTAGIGSRGFTLVELLVVLAIVAILGVAVSGLAGTLTGSTLSQATNDVASYLRSARQAAITTDSKVEVRFYQYADPTFSGEVAGTPSTGKYRALWQLQVNDSSGSNPAQWTYTVLRKPLYLPAGIVIDSGTTLSSLFSPTLNPMLTPTASNTDTRALGTITNTQYLGFHFNRDGTTDLGVGTNWFVTLHSVKVGDALTTAPANYATVRIDPVNGAIAVLRPQ